MWRTTLPEDVVRQVESDVELTCLQVANVKRLLHDALALAGRKTVCPL
jgi:hypothetical protein